MTSWFNTTDRFRDPVGAKRVAQFVHALSRFPPGHLIDLGAGHGIFSRLAAELGWRVTAVDVRDERFPDDGRIKWVVSDVREFDDYADADVVVCLGLWYHLTLDDQLGLAKKISPRPLILDTHVALPTLPEYQNPNRTRISEVLSQQGFPGRVYNEAGLEARATASWGNEESYWPSLASLERQMYGVGYEVFEQISPPYLPDRGFFVAQTLGDDAAHQKIEAMVTKFNPVVKPDAPVVTAPAPTLAPTVEVKPAVAAAPAAPRRSNDIPPLRTASKQFVASFTRSARRRVGNLRSTR